MPIGGKKFTRPLVTGQGSDGFGQPLRASSGAEDARQRLRENEANFAKRNQCIIIHVFDENGTQNFSCNVEQLLRHMKYFESYLAPGGRKGPSSVGTGSTDANSATVANYDDLDISVHCEIGVFQWLVNYIENPTAQVDEVNVQNVVSILMAAEFLMMQDLVDFCLGFFKNSFDAVIALPIDLNCLPSTLIEKLAVLFTDDEIEGLAPDESNAEVQQQDANDEDESEHSNAKGNLAVTPGPVHVWQCFFVPILFL